MNNNHKIVAYVDENFLEVVKERQNDEEKLLNETKSKAELELSEFYERRKLKLQQRRHVIKSNEQVLLQERKFNSIKDEFQAVKSMVNLEDMTTNERYVEVLKSYISEN